MRSEPLAEALRFQRAAAKQGFDWRVTRELWDKLAEEIAELKRARTGQARFEELGDLMFMLVNLARHLGVEPGRALAAATRKFQRRYALILKHLEALPPLGHPQRLEAMEALWQEAKRREKRTPGRRVRPAG